MLALLYSAILRPLARDYLRTTLSVIAIALGIAAVVAIQMANRAALESFRASVQEITGRTNLQITALAPFSEELLPRVYQAFEGQQALVEISPVVEGVAVEAHTGETIDVLAVDLATDRAVRDTSAEGAPTARDSLLLLRDPMSVLVGRDLAARYNLRPGSTWNLLLNDRPQTLTVRAVLTGTFSGRVAVLDIAGGQALFGREGKLDRIDLVVPPEMLSEARQRIAALLPAGLIVESPATRTAQSEKMLRAFRLNLSALAMVSLIVGAFLIYNTIAVSVVRRRAEIGALRAVGMTRAGVVALFLAEASLLGLLGAAAGIVLGRAIAGRATELVALTTSTFWVPARTVEPELGVPLVLFAAALAVTAAILSALAPALEAARVDPADALRRGAHEHRSRLHVVRNAAFGVAALVIAGGLSQLPAAGSVPLAGYAAAVMIVTGFGLLMPLVLRAFTRLAGSAMRAAGTVMGTLAARSLSAALGRASVLAMALATAIAMMASVAIMVHSFRETVRIWTEQTFRADLFIRTAADRGRTGQPLISPETAAAIASVPGVAAADTFRQIPITFRGEPAYLGAANFEVWKRHVNLLFLDGRSSADVMQGEGIIITEPFALRHRVGTGDTIALPTPTGERPMRVLGVYYDYSSDRGYAVMDRSSWLRFGGDEYASSLAVYLTPGADGSAVREEISRRTAGHRLRITSSGELKAAVLRIFDRTFAITWTLEGIAILIAVLGIANALLALVLERRREFGILRYLGATRDQLRRLVLYEAGLLGALAAATGLILGFVLSLVLVYVINRQSFGWTVQFSLPWVFLAQSTLLVFLVACLSAIYPARKASMVDPVEAVAVE